MCPASKGLTHVVPAHQHGDRIARPTPFRRLCLRAVLVAAGICLGLGCAEIGARLFLVEDPPQQVDERSLLHAHDPELGWFPTPGKRIAFTGGRTISVVNNADGFRDRDHDLGSPRRRVLVLGDSYVWGYDVEQEERFTELLQVELEDLDIFNMGVSGYATDQELLLLERFADKYRPSLVVVVFCTANDPFENARSIVYGCAKPYFQLEDNELKLRGVPVPVTPKLTFRQSFLGRYSYLARFLLAHHCAVARPELIQDLSGRLLLAMRKRAAAANATFLVAMLTELPLTLVFDKQGIPWVSLGDVTMAGNTWNPETVYPAFGRHWNPEGHRRVARILEPRLRSMLPAE